MYNLYIKINNYNKKNMLNNLLLNDTHKKDCKQFWNDYDKCANFNSDNKIINSINMSKQNPKPWYFNFFECDEYKNTYHKNKIEFNPNDIKYPYNKYYKIEKVDKVIKINMYD
jgi:hypothetical protein